jgi:hypothetical protein
MEASGLSALHGGEHLAVGAELEDRASPGFAGELRIHWLVGPRAERRGHFDFQEDISDAGEIVIAERRLHDGLSAFVPIRVLEQIKLDLCYNRFGANIVSTGASFDYAWDGAKWVEHFDFQWDCYMGEGVAKVWAPAKSWAFYTPQADGSC